MLLKPALLLVHLALGFLIALAIGLLDAVGAGRRVPRERIARWWHRDLLAILKVRVQVRGAPLRGPRMTVANHVSWLDICVIGAIEPTRFLSRHDVQQWPIAGQLADACGTFYIVRGKGGAGRVVERLVPHLRGGGSVVVFPEGTTSDGSSVLPFHARLFQAPLTAGVPVQPVALRYSAGPAPFIGDTSLFAHVLRVLGAGELFVEVSYGPALVGDQATCRDGVAAQAQRWIARALGRGPLRSPGFRPVTLPAAGHESVTRPS